MPSPSPSPSPLPLPSSSPSLTRSPFSPKTSSHSPTASISNPKHPKPPSLPRTRNPRHDHDCNTTTTPATATLKTSDLDSATTSHNNSENNNDDLKNPDDHLARLIHAYADLDLNRDNDAFYAWMERKTSQTKKKPKNPPQNTTTTKTPPSPSSSSAPQQRGTKALKQNDPESAFRAWLESKARAASVRKQTLLAISSPTISTDTNPTVDEKEKKLARTQLEIKLWHRGKRVCAQRELLDEVKRERMREWEGRKKRQAAKVAFKAWVERKNCEAAAAVEGAGARSTGRGRDVQDEAWAVHPREWVTDADGGEGRSSSTSRPSARRAAHGYPAKPVPASPPNVFTDYPRCAALAPQYVNRYRVLVASAGANTQPPKTVNRPSAAASRHDWQTPPVLTKRGGPWIAAGGYGHVDKAEKKVARAEVA
ncbi:hypothetical protein HDU88_004145 [Geranomyces variabilis]|nr:hypothetical protein HDU88_004145 [Geranomyces variabilis]